MGGTLKRYSSRRNTAPLYLVFLVLFVLLWIVYKQYQKHSDLQSISETLLQDATMLEVRYRHMGDFFDLYSWFAAVTYLEGRNFEYTGRYIDAAALPDSVKRRVSMDQIGSVLKDFTWSKGIHLEEFIDYASLKARLRARFGMRFEQVTSALDSSKYRYTMEFEGDNAGYVLTVFEKSDVNFDEDNADFFTYESETERIRFTNKVNRENYRTFYINYSNSLAKIPPR